MKQLKLKPFSTEDDKLFDKELKENIEFVADQKVLYKYMTVDGVMKTLESCNIKFSNPDDFNDPFDCDPRMIDFSNPTEEYYNHLVDTMCPNAKYTQRQNALIEIRKKGLKFTFRNVREIADVRVSCFTIDKDNLLMWSHYANKHTGCCIAFNLEELYSSLLIKYDNVRCLRVEYSKDFPTISYYKCPKRAATSWCILKSEDWKYEKEIRMLVNTNNSIEGMDSLPLPKSVFCSIYLGAKISSDDKDKIIQICRERYGEIEIYQMNLKAGRFELEPVQIF